MAINAIWNAYNHLNYSESLDLDKFTQIVHLVQQDTETTAAQVADFIDGGEDGWTETIAEHSVWLRATSAEDIADWIIAGQ